MLDGARAPRAADGPRARAASRSIENLNTLPEVTWIQPTAGRPRRGRRRAGDDPARARRRAPAPAAAAARGADPLRGAALEGGRGRGAARDERRVGEQRAPAGAGDARDERPERRGRGALGRRGRRASCSRATSRRSSATTWSALTALIQEDATQSMPPFDLWLAGRDDIFTWWSGPGIGCKGSRVIPTVAANGSPAFGQYKPSETGSGFDPWALQVLEVQDGADRRAHVLPRHRDAVPALRATAPARRLAPARPMKAISSTSSGEARRRRSRSRAPARQLRAARGRRASTASARAGCVADDGTRHRYDGPLRRSETHRRGDR